MPAVGKVQVAITQHIRNLGGSSKSALVKASDGLLYVAKFTNNIQGPNVLFNESIGVELYRACGLRVPSLRRLMVTPAFLGRGPRCWGQTREEGPQPATGLCLGSLFLGGGEIRLSEILPGNSFRRVSNRESFYLAWMIDICGRHADSRQAIFMELPGGVLSAFFVDHGHMFAGPNGDMRPNFLTSRHLDRRIYQSVSSKNLLRMQRAAADLNVDLLWQRAHALPDEWKTDSAIESFRQCLERLSDASFLQDIVDKMIAVTRPNGSYGPAIFPQPREQQTPVLCPGVQDAELGWPVAPVRPNYRACA
jgi:hypothetical protein